MRNDHLFTVAYPLTTCQCGTPLGNGWLGLLVWGEGRQLNLTIGCADLWDHRGGMSWSEKHNYRDIRQALAAADQPRLQRMFASDTEAVPGQPRRPSLIPVGRLCLTLPDGWKLLDNRLDMASGELRVTAGRAGRRTTLRLLLHPLDKGLFAIRGRLTGTAAYHSSYELAGRTLADVAFPPPFSGRAGDWNYTVQPMPADPPFAVAWRRDGTQLTVSLRRGQGQADDWEERYRSCPAADWTELAAASRHYWQEFWRQVPVLQLANPRLQALYQRALFRFESMTAADGVPAGLQGPWIEDNALPPWQGDYHFNINIQMCYWPAYRSGRLQNLLPLFRMVWSWREQLRRNARCFAGIEDGYMLPHAVDDRCTCMGGFWTGSIDHACTAWVAQMMFDYYDYSGDRRFLKEVAYDFMLGTLRVYVAMLEPADGGYRLPVSVSPEYRGSAMDAWGANASFQLAALHRLLRNLEEAAAILGRPAEPLWAALRTGLPPAALAGEPGAEEIALWEGLRLETSHRHHSHLAGLVPFDTLPDTPAWHQILQRSLQRWKQLGMGEWTGWCVPWAAMLHSHAGNGPFAEALLELWERCFNNAGGGSTHDAVCPGLTIYDFRPDIMQMDGYMGALTAIQDMFLHQRHGVLQLFAGIPPRWPQAAMQRLPAPGGFLVSASWRQGHIITLAIEARRAATLRLALPESCRGALPAAARWQDGIVTLDMQPGDTLRLG